MEEELKVKPGDAGSDLPVVLHLPRGRDNLLARAVLEGGGITSVIADCVSDAIARVPDAGLIILQQESLDRKGLAELGMALLAQPKWSDLPVLMLTDRNAPLTREIRDLSERANVLFLERPLRRSMLRAMVRSSLQTRRRQLEMRDLMEDLHQAKESAEAATRAKSVFLSQMSHDIRTPLTSILGFAEILCERAEGTERELAAHIAESGSRLMETLNSVLELARLEGRQRQLDIRAINVREKLERSARVFQRDIESKGLDIEVSCAPALHVLADRAALGRVLMNLVGNAVKFTQKGRIELTARNAGGRVEICVCDTGIGISEEFLPQVFEAFRRESSSVNGVADGSGLGLAITRQLVEVMGGTISVQSKRGEGTRFCIRLALAHGDGAENSAPAALPALPVFKRKPSILFVEDNASTRQVIRHLVDGQLDATIAEGFDEALTLVERKHFDAGLIDINLGEERSGEDLLRSIRAVPGYKEVPLVAFTAFVLPEEQQRFREAGFIECLNKPFSRDELLRTVATVLSVTADSAAPER